jgi:hypothetical protein
LGNGFTASPEGLRYTAKHDLETLIDRLEDGKGRLTSTVKHDSEAFTGGSEVEQAQVAWHEARELLVSVFEDNIENLKLAQDALVEIARRYGADDEEATHAIRASSAGMPS